MQQGTPPPSQRHAIIMPRIKKPNDDPIHVRNYGTLLQLMAFIEQENLLLVHQLSYSKCYACSRSRCDHMTGLARYVRRIWYDRLWHSNWTSSQTFDVHGSALAWINSFISNRMQTVFFNGQRSIHSHWIATILKAVWLDRYFSFSKQPTSLQSPSIVDSVHIPMQMILNCMNILNLHQTMYGQLV